MTVTNSSSSQLLGGILRRVLLGAQSLVFERGLDPLGGENARGGIQ